ncbi:formylmethanofuran dehydrogenase subunit E [Geosporobacter subterraneus DSM 17957]|uniref:Formylmethanofuran dehydrogenase subunit E n=1 Tax=Geosporobacter subterraneus DSM 17957 TaxID=1121919 RepID=A0A1M6GGC9_9FIRM|nr:FmdE family protein [Geosporobacter subterraneus]SHJ08995.1 formylmethanofuran dehydrogenase subunit E [Geosporobacter subterraneus DSM 17957]
MDHLLWEKSIDFHGHACPGLAIGFKAALAALEKLKINRSSDEELVCVTENDACGVDAVQVVTGCTFGKGNLIYRGTGKQAFTFFHRPSGKSIRIVYHKSRSPHGTDKHSRMMEILAMNPDSLFQFKVPSFQLPEEARIFNSVTCEICGEQAPEHKIRLQNEKKVCLDCFVPYSREIRL